MDEHGMRAIGRRASANDKGRSKARRRSDRRRAFWAAVSETLLSIPPGIAVRLGG